MSYTKKCLYLILFLMKETVFAFTNSSLESPLEHDINITHLVKQWFSQKLQVHFAELIEVERLAFDDVYTEYYAIKDFVYDLDHEVEPFGSQFFFAKVLFEWSYTDKFRSDRCLIIDWNSQRNEMEIFYGKFQITVSGEWFTEDDDIYATFTTRLLFKNFTLKGTQQSYGGDVFPDISYSECTLWRYLNKTEVEWSNNTDLIHNTSQAKILTAELKPALIAMLRKYLNGNYKLYQEFEARMLELNYSPWWGYGWPSPNIFGKENKIYYISNISLCGGLTLKDVVIRNLTNINPLRFYRADDPCHFSVLIKNVHGSAALNYGREDKKPSELRFKIDRLSICVEEDQCVRVEAPQFEFNSTSGPLTSKLSTILMQSIESTLISSIMPSNKICNVKNEVNDDSILENLDLF